MAPAACQSSLDTWPPAQGVRGGRQTRAVGHDGADDHGRRGTDGIRCQTVPGAGSPIKAAHRASATRPACFMSMQAMGAKWGATIGRQSATQSQAERSRFFDDHLSNDNQPHRATIKTSFASRGQRFNFLSSTEFLQVRQPVRFGNRAAAAYRRHVFKWSEDGQRARRG
jgi:hypothetical protein